MILGVPILKHFRVPSLSKTGHPKDALRMANSEDPDQSAHVLLL